MLHFLSSGDAELPPSSARAAIVSLIVGEPYETVWKRICRGPWLAYAERIGVDIVILTDRIDKSDLSRSPAWQKLLILDLPWSKRYERIIWLDSDVTISDTAPNVLDYAGPPEKIGICIDGGRMSPVEGQIYLERTLNIVLPPDAFANSWPSAQRELYVMNNLPPHDVIFNTGVMVLSPQHHAELLSSVYASPQLTTLYEQPYLSHRLLADNLAHIMSPRFNWGVIEPMQIFVQSGLKAQREEDEALIGRVILLMIRGELYNSYFLHFYGSLNLLMPFLKEPTAKTEISQSAA